MKVLNPGASSDYHIHSSTFSDGFNSIDEIVIQAGKLEYSEIAITDHCQNLLDAYGMARKTHYDILKSGRWENVHNNVNVIFGVEADILNEKGDIGKDIQGAEPDFIILSSHKKVYQGQPELIKEAYLNAIERFGNKIKFLGHLCSTQFSEFLSPNCIIEIVEAAEKENVAVELNCANLMHNKTCMPNLEAMLSVCGNIYVNSDAHTMHELIYAREIGFEFLNNRE